MKGRRTNLGSNPRQKQQASLRRCRGVWATSRIGLSHKFKGIVGTSLSCLGDGQMRRSNSQSLTQTLGSRHWGTDSQYPVVSVGWKETD